MLSTMPILVMTACLDCRSWKKESRGPRWPRWSAKAPEEVRRAADEFQRVLEKMTGTRLPAQTAGRWADRSHRARRLGGPRRAGTGPARRGRLRDSHDRRSPFDPGRANARTPPSLPYTASSRSTAACDGTFRPPWARSSRGGPASAWARWPSARSPPSTRGSGARRRPSMAGPGSVTTSAAPGTTSITTC